MTHISAAFKKYSLILYMVTTGISGMNPSVAQELNLFEAVEADAEPGTGPFQVQESISLPGSKPAFTLRSTSRVGDNYHSVLINRDGNVTEVNWQPGQQVPLPGYESFAVINIAGRQVSVRQPGNENCVTDETLGVRCEGNVAQLTLATLSPVVNSQAIDAIFGPTVGDPFEAAAQAAQANQGGFAVQGQQVVINPFSGEPELVPQLSPEEQAARVERQAARAARLRQFEPERINEADVPDGMRLVRTPFGDRVVPIRQ